MNPAPRHQLQQSNFSVTARVEVSLTSLKRKRLDTTKPQTPPLRSATGGASLNKAVKQRVCQLSGRMWLLHDLQFPSGASVASRERRAKKKYCNPPCPKGNCGPSWTNARDAPNPFGLSRSSPVTEVREQCKTRHVVTLSLHHHHPRGPFWTHERLS